VDGGPCGLWVWGWTVSDAVDLVHVSFDICRLCLGGAGGECHVPGCVSWMDDAPRDRLLGFLNRLYSRVVGS
jgi:hypothetical protein